MIPGTTDRTRLPRLGKVRLGEKKISQRGREYPAALDYFSFRDVPELEAIFGKNAREMYPILLPADDENVWFPTSLTAYTKTGLFCRCTDGVTADRTYKGEADPQGHAFVTEQGIEVKEGERFELPCPGAACTYYERGFCKGIGRLMFMVPDSPRFGVYEITTSSWNGIVNVLNMARAIRQAAGRLFGIPLALKLVPIQVQPDGKAKTVHVLELEFRDGGVRKLMAMGQKARGGGLAIEPGKDEVPEDLYPLGGAKLDAALGGIAPAPAPAPPALPGEHTNPPIVARGTEPADDDDKILEFETPPSTPEPRPAGTPIRAAARTATARRTADKAAIEEQPLASETGTDAMAPTNQRAASDDLSFFDV